MRSVFNQLANDFQEINNRFSNYNSSQPSFGSSSSSDSSTAFSSDNSTSTCSHSSSNSFFSSFKSHFSPSISRGFDPSNFASLNRHGANLNVDTLSDQVDVSSLSRPLHDSPRQFFGNNVDDKLDAFVSSSSTNLLNSTDRPSQFFSPERHSSPSSLSSASCENSNLTFSSSSASNNFFFSVDSSSSFSWSSLSSLSSSTPNQRRPPTSLLSNLNHTFFLSNHSSSTSSSSSTSAHWSSFFMSSPVISSFSSAPYSSRMPYCGTKSSSLSTLLSSSASKTQKIGGTVTKTTDPYLFPPPSPPVTSRADFKFDISRIESSKSISTVPPYCYSEIQNFNQNSSASLKNSITLSKIETFAFSVPVSVNASTSCNNVSLTSSSSSVASSSSSTLPFYVAASPVPISSRGCQMKNICYSNNFFPGKEKVEARERNQEMVNEQFNSQDKKLYQSFKRVNNRHAHAYDDEHTCEYLDENNDFYENNLNSYEQDKNIKRERMFKSISNSTEQAGKEDKEYENIYSKVEKLKKKYFLNKKGVRMFEQCNDDENDGKQTRSEEEKKNEKVKETRKIEPSRHFKKKVNQLEAKSQEKSKLKKIDRKIDENKIKNKDAYFCTLENEDEKHDDNKGVTTSSNIKKLNFYHEKLKNFVEENKILREIICELKIKVKLLKKKNVEITDRLNVFLNEDSFLPFSGVVPLEAHNKNYGYNCDDSHTLLKKKNQDTNIDVFNSDNNNNNNSYNDIDANNNNNKYYYYYYHSSSSKNDNTSNNDINKNTDNNYNINEGVRKNNEVLINDTKMRINDGLNTLMNCHEIYSIHNKNLLGDKQNNKTINYKYDNFNRKIFENKKNDKNIVMNNNLALNDCFFGKNIYDMNINNENPSHIFLAYDSNLFMLKNNTLSLHSSKFSEGLRDNLNAKIFTVENDPVKNQSKLHTHDQHTDFYHDNNQQKKHSYNSIAQNNFYGNKHHDSENYITESNDTSENNRIKSDECLSKNPCLSFLTDNTSIGEAQPQNNHCQTNLYTSSTILPSSSTVCSRDSLPVHTPHSNDLEKKLPTRNYSDNIIYGYKKKTKCKFNDGSTKKKENQITLLQKKLNAKVLIQNLHYSSASSPLSLYSSAVLALPGHHQHDGDTSVSSAFSLKPSSLSSSVILSTSSSFSPKSSVFTSAPSGMCIKQQRNLRTFSLQDTLSNISFNLIDNNENYN